MFNKVRKSSQLILLFFFVFVGFSIIHAENNKAAAVSNMDIILQSAGTKYIGQQFNVDVRVDTDGNQVDTISIRNFNFDQTKIQYIGTGIQSVFASQTTLINTGGIGFRRVDIGKLPLTANYSNTSHATVARFTFLAINTGGGPTGTTNLTLNFDPTPATTGTFLAGVKNLDGVTGLTINLAEDNTVPVISNCIPVSAATNVAVTTSVSCDVQDFETGIFLGGTTMTVNSVTYSNTGPNQYSTSAITNGFRLTVTPASQFSYYTNIPVTVTAQDNAYDNGPVLARNGTTLPVYTFLTEDDNDAPEVYSRNPNNGAINIAVNTNVNLNIRDIANPGGYPGTGVDLSTLQITITATGWGPVTYTQSGPNTFSATPINVPWNYSISINPAIDLPQNSIVNVSIVASDFDNVAPSPNTLNTNYSFTTLDSVAPVCSFVSPNPGTVNNPVNASVVINCTDSGVGVDINSMIFIVNGIAYLSSGPNVFSFTGTPSTYNITVTPATNFSTEYAFDVVVMGEDLSNNEMPVLSYGLATGTSSVICSACPVCNPVTNTITNTVTNTVVQACPTDLSVSDTGILIRENIVQVPFRTTEKELENIQIYKINDFEIGVNVERIEIRFDKIVFSGIAQQYANVTLMIESNPIIITTIADAEGKWETEMQNILPVGEHKVFAIARNELTGEVTQKNLFAYLDIVPQSLPESSNIWQIIIPLLLILISGYLGYRYGKNKSESKDTKEKLDKNKGKIF
jgi:hypothetical protein